MVSVTEVEKKEVWEKFNIASKTPSFLQSWAWGDFEKALGKEVFRLGISENNSLIGICLLVLEKAKTATFFYVPEGPLFLRWEKTALDVLIKFITDLAKERSVSFLRFDTRIFGDEESSLLEKYGFLPAPTFTQPQTTSVIDLKRSEEELLKNMSSSTRYNIGMSMRRGVKVRKAKEEEVNSFKNLLDSTARKKKLTLQKEEDYHTLQYEVLHREGLMEMFVSEFEGRLLAAALVVFYGKTAYYLHAANSYEHSDLRVSYPLVWNTVLEAKNKGSEVFDFWGVAKDEDPNDSWAGVTAFKMSFGAQRVFYQLPLDLPFSNRYKWVTLVEKYRKPIKNIFRLKRK